MNLYYWIGHRRSLDKRNFGKVPAWGYVEAGSKNEARSLVREEYGYSPDEVLLIPDDMQNLLLDGIL